MAEVKPFSPYELADPVEEVKAKAEHQKFRTSDMWNAEALVRKWGHMLHFVHDWGKWLVWDGRRWAPDNTGMIFQYARDTVRHFYKLAAGEDDAGERKTLARHALRSENKPKITAMVALAESETGIPVTPEQLDWETFLFTLMNGTFDLRAGKLLEHDQEHLITKLSPVKHDPEADCPAWRSFLSMVMDGNEYLMTFLQKAAGYSLTGVCDERCIFILYGKGRNGKTTFVETFAELLGDYARTRVSKI